VINFITTHQSKQTLGAVHIKTRIYLHLNYINYTLLKHVLEKA